MFALSSRVIVVICVVFSHCYAIHIAFSHYCCCLLLALPFCSCVGHVVHVVLSRFHCYSSWATVAIVTTFVTLPFVLLFLQYHSFHIAILFTLLVLHYHSSHIVVFAMSFFLHATLLVLLFLHYCFSRIALLRLSLLLHFKSLLSCYFFHIIALFTFHVPIGPTFVDFLTLSLLLFSYCCCFVLLSQHGISLPLAMCKLELRHQLEHQR